MNTYEYELRGDDGMPSGKKETIEADWYERKYNERSDMWEYIFHAEQGEIIIPVYWVTGRIKEIGR